MSFESIAKYTGSSSTASWDAINFTSLPQTYKHLMVVGKIAMSYGTSTAATIQFRLNNDSTAGAYNTQLQGSRDSTGTVDSSSASNSYFSAIGHARPASNGDVEYGSITIYLPSYSSSTAKKNIFIWTNSVTDSAPSGENRCWVYGGYWNNSAAVTSLNFFSDTSPDFSSFTDISIYGLKDS